MKRLSLIAVLTITVAAMFAATASADGSFTEIRPWPMVHAPGAAGYFVLYDKQLGNAKVEIRVFKARVGGGWRLVHSEAEMGRQGGLIYDLYRSEIREPRRPVTGTYLIRFRLIDPGTNLVADVENRRFRLSPSSRFTIYL
jgi:hypothetical protein